jgi:tetratricopeptide (TPR) repeat protein
MDNKKAFSHLPISQRISIEYKQRLKTLVKNHPKIHISIPEKNLSNAVEEMLDKVGFDCHPATKKESADLALSVGGWLRKGHLVLLRYRARSSDTNLLGFLRAMKGFATHGTFTGLVPIFIGSVETDKQLEIFRNLGQFGIRYACFLSSNTLPERNAEELLEHLVEYGELLQNGFVVPEKEAPKERGVDIGKTLEYKDIFRKGEELLRLGKYEEAIVMLTRAIEIGANTITLMKRGDAYYRIKQYTQALNDYREANRLEDKVPDPYAMIGTCCFAIMKDETKSKNPVELKKYFDMGMKYLNEAIKLTEEIESKNRKYPERLPRAPYASIVTALAEADLRGMGIVGSEAELEKLSNKVLGKIESVDFLSADTDIYLRIDRAMLLARSEHYDDAEEIFMGVIQEDPQKAGPVFNNYAVELRNNGEIGRAFDTYTELLKHNVPDRDIIIENMRVAGLRYAQEFRGSGMMEEAIVIYKKVLMHNPRKKEFVLCEMAMAYLGIQDQAAASSRLMEAVYINPKLTESTEFKKYGDLTNIADEMIKKIRQSFLGEKTT